MVVDKIVDDAEFGHIYIRTHASAVRYTFRPAHDGSATGGILVTAPRYFTLSDVASSVEKMRPRLREMLQREAQRQATAPPRPTPEQEAERRHRLLITHRLAVRDLPGRLAALAQQHGFKYDAVRITATRSRWGSCQRRRAGLLSRSRVTISLSLYVWLLPEHLQRLVMLHELTHIHHMDHSPAFHAELDAMLDGHEHAYNQELKQYRIEEMVLPNS